MDNPRAGSGNDDYTGGSLELVDPDSRETTTTERSALNGFVLRTEFARLHWDVIITLPLITRLVLV